MGSVEDIAPGASGQREASVHECVLCHRVRVVYGEHQESTEWEQITNFVRHYWVRSPDFSTVVDTFCDGCTLYYYQLMKYGQSTREPEASIFTAPSSVQETVSMGLSDLCQS
jgi:hypothetical protein